MMDSWPRMPYIETCVRVSRSDDRLTNLKRQINCREVRRAMKILFSGIIGRYPFGGVAWCSLMYLIGFRMLGHEVCYIEDTGECVYDWEKNSLSENPAYGIRCIRNTLEPFGLRNHWCYVNYDGTYYGLSQDALRSYCAEADLFVNLSGGTWFWRDEYSRIPRRVFVDSDPVFTQLAIAKGEPWYVDFFRQFDHLFTFGANIGSPQCDVPTSGFTWEKTWQPVITGLWATDKQARLDKFTTVMTWRTESFTDVDGNKDREFFRFLDLPGRTPTQFELAVNGPQQLLAEYGWSPVDAMNVSRTIWTYRDFIQNSKAEFGIAKHAYVFPQSGWFSDRTECYLAAGRPALVQETGWSEHVPSGVGLLPFSTTEEAIEGLARLESDYQLHARRASEIARECFDASRVLPPFLEKACR